jgi:hypothetical protein
MPTSCSQCLATGLAILPVRQTLLPSRFKVDVDIGEGTNPVWKDLPQMLSMPAWAGCEWEGQKFGADAKPGLRIMRAGYLYVHYPEARMTVYGVAGKWEVYTVNESGTFSLSGPDAPKPPLTAAGEGGAPCSRCGPSSVKSLSHITIPDPANCAQAYVAFSQHAWTRATRQRVAADPGARMTAIKPAQIIEQTSPTASGTHWTNLNEDEVQKVLEYCPHVPYAILWNYEASSKLTEKVVSQAMPGHYHHELTAHSRDATSKDPEECGQHDHDVLRRWYSRWPAQFRYSMGEGDTKGFKMGKESFVYSNNSLEAPADRGDGKWRLALLANTIEPMAARGKPHPGILLALDDPLGVAGELVGAMNQLHEFRMQYETQRRAELEASTAIRDLPALAAYKESNRQLTKTELKQRMLGPDARIDEVHVPAWDSSTTSPTTMVPTTTHHPATIEYRVRQSPQDALAEAKRGGLLGKKLYDTETGDSYRQRVIEKSRERMSAWELEERRPYLGKDAVISEGTHTTGGSPSLGIPSSTDTYYTVQQSDSSALKEADRPGPLQTKVLDDRIWAPTDFHNAADYYQEVDWKRHDAFVKNYKNFLDAREKLLEARSRVVSEWLKYEGLIAVLEDYDAGVDDEALACAEVIEDLLEGIDAAEPGKKLYAEWAELKVSGKKNLLVRLLSCGMPSEEENVTIVLRKAYDFRDTRFDDLSKVNQWAQHMKLPVGLYRSTMGASIHDILANRGAGIKVPGSANRLKPLPSTLFDDFHTQRFNAMEALGGGGLRDRTVSSITGKEYVPARWWGRDYKLFQWIGFNRKVEWLGSNIVYRFLLTGWFDDARIDAELLKNTVPELNKAAEELTRNTDITEVSKASRDATRWKVDERGALPKDAPKDDVKAALGRDTQKQLTARGAGLAAIVGAAELARLYFLLQATDKPNVDQWVLKRQILACGSVIMQCCFDLAAQAARANEIPAGEAVQYISRGSRFTRFSSGVFGGMASLLSSTIDWHNLGKEQEKNEIRYAILWCKLGLDSAQALFGLYVAATYSRRVTGAVRMSGVLIRYLSREVAIETVATGMTVVARSLFTFGSRRILGMLLGPWGMLASVLIEVAIWRASDDRMEDWVEKSAFGKTDTRKLGWLNDPDLQLDELGRALYEVGYRDEDFPADEPPYAEQ